MKNYRYNKIFYLLFIISSIACSNNKVIEEIKISTHNNNELKIQIDVLSKNESQVYIEYWCDSLNEKYVSLTSEKGLSHKLVLCNIIPQANYSFKVISIIDGKKIESKKYTFKSRALPVWLQDQFKYTCTDLNTVPAQFKEGLMLMNKREAPGVLYLVDYKARLRWYHMIDGIGFKVARFTQDTSIISILGKNDEPTSYGSQILEINFLGDTLLYLKKGQGDLRQTIHHEVLKRNKNEIVTLFVDEKVLDLRKIGGGKNDTVSSDGILILDRNGKQLWKWSVFDVADPLKDTGLLRNKKDWTHANSLNYDKDSNFLISFYNNGQIWKVDAHSGQVLWKFGKGGDVKMPLECNFSQSHAVHINKNGSMMFFDNGVSKKQSEVYAMQLNQKEKSSTIDIHFKLPTEVYNERMGSAYLVNDTAILSCCSKKHITVLSNAKGKLIWTLNTGIPPYRVEFLTPLQFAPFLKPLLD